MSEVFLDYGKILGEFFEGESSEQNTLIKLMKENSNENKEVLKGYKLEWEKLKQAEGFNRHINPGDLTGVIDRCNSDLD